MIGRTIGHYKIREQLGSGGMGVVYLAVDTRLDRTVALKFLPAHLSADPTSKERFIQEARAASALDHANICTIYDIGEDDEGRTYIVMAHYDGETLKKKIADGPLPVEEALEIAYQLSGGLARAHEAGIVHRDIKPANIMVTSRDEVKILDFGVAKLSQSSDLTQSGSTIGTAAYMSPEQSRGETVMPTADVWSVGVVLYEMLTGRRPFSGGYEAALVYAIINEAPVSPSDVEPDIPSDVAELVLAALDKDPEERIADAGALHARIGQVLSPSGSRLATSVGTRAPAASASSPPGPGRVTAIYLPIAALTLGLVYVAMIGFGLPDWVFGAGLLLLLTGLPALVFAAIQEQRKAEGRPLGGPFEWLSFRRAVIGGVVSMSGLTVLAAAYMIMRVSGIGPAASLQSSGALNQDAQIIVADFDNKTSEPAMSSSISELFRIALSQSNVVEIMDGADIVGVLSRMNRPSDAAIDRNTAMEIAAREGAEAVVIGEISPIGSGYFLAAKLLAAHDGSELVALSRTARSADDVIDAVGDLSKDLRSRIGESIKAIRSNEDLDRVTTSSLDALRLYTQGVAAEDRGDVPRAIDLLEQAIERDSLFGMAYRKLAVVYTNAGMAVDQRIEAATRAYELRMRLPERERWLTEAYYHTTVTNNHDRRIAAYESLLERYPNNTAALNNIAVALQRLQEFERAEPYLRRALELGERGVYFHNMFNVLGALKKFEEAAQIIDVYEAAHPGHPLVPSMRAYLAILTGRHDGADSLITVAERSSDPIWVSWDNEVHADWALHTGRMSLADSKIRAAAQAELDRNNKAAALEKYLKRAERALSVEEDPAGARAWIGEGLSAVPLDSLSALSRPYTVLAMLYAEIGDLELAQFYLSRFDNEIPENYQKEDYSGYWARAAILRAQGDQADAIRSIQDSHKEFRCKSCFALIEARYLSESDSVHRAIAAYEKYQDFSAGWSPQFTAGTKSAAWLEMGELYSRVGDTEKAIEAYSNFVDLWSEADPHLQPKVRYARDRIQRLMVLSAQEPS